MIDFLKTTRLNMSIRLMRLSCLALLFFASTAAQAQFGVQTSLLKDNILSQTYQPANIAEGEYGSFRYGGQAGFWLGNTHASLKGVFDENGYIKEVTKDRLISELKANEDLAGGLHLGFASVNVKFGDRPVGFYLDEYNTASARFNNPHTLGLILKGNGPYAGDTISDDGISARLMRVREIAVGTGWKLEQLSLGVRLRLKQGIRMLELNDLSYRLFTETNGTVVHANAAYELNMSPTLSNNKLFEFQGFGAGVDIGLRYQINETMDFDFALNNVGAMSWTTNQLKDEVDIEWKGITVTNLFAGGLSDTIDEQIDSLQAIILPDTVEGNRLLMTPAIVRAGFNWRMNEKSLLAGNIIWSPIKGGWHSRLPMISVAYQYEVMEGLKFGANAYGLGLDTFGFGLMGNYHFNAGNMGFDVLAGSDNLLGFVAPGFGRGMSVYAGIGVSL